MSADLSNPIYESLLSEDEIFKSLSHQLRRNILKVVASHKTPTFTEIKNQMDKLGSPIDSPTLSYHLKSLKFLLEQKDNTYFLTDLGNTAIILINKIDQSKQLQKSRKSFLYANIITTIIWNVLQIIVVNIIWPYIDLALWVTILILFILFNQLNVQIVWKLYASGYGLARKPKRKMNEIAVE